MISSLIIALVLIVSDASGQNFFKNIFEYDEFADQRALESCLGRRNAQILINRYQNAIVNCGTSDDKTIFLFTPTENVEAAVTPATTPDYQRPDQSDRNLVQYQRQRYSRGAPSNGFDPILFLRTQMYEMNRIEMDRMNNLTCFFKGLGYLNKYGILDLESNLMRAESYISEDPSFTAIYKRDLTLCYDLAQSVSDDFLRSIFHDYPELAKVKIFGQCSDQKFKKMCKHFDVKKNFERRFGSRLNQLGTQLGLDEESMTELADFAFARQTVASLRRFRI